MAPRATVQPNDDMDLRLNPPGKLCAANGTPHIPGTMQRAHSMPNSAFTCPSGWAADTCSSVSSRGREYKERMRRTASLAHSMTSGSWGDVGATLRPSTSQVVETIRCPGGGRTQGALDLRPQTSAVYDSAKHGWQHPIAQAESRRLANPAESGSWKWMMRKARDHIGYGDDGMVNWGDVQTTAISGDGPAWLVGPRTVPGPFSTKTVPVRRCPEVSIKGQDMRIRAKTYTQGEGLCSNEIIHDTPFPPTPEKVRKKIPIVEQHQLKMNKAKWNNLDMGGCQTRDHVNTFPPTLHVTYESHHPKGNHRPFAAKNRHANHFGPIP
eukprot:TRINITY_DN22596_c0_g1_i1.p1 TRINITY_DN22596_c0_g1~~TRINITY_DN22596_c0_g1_i1.p1  ORF type:complete len:324 (-),score=55.10 TRINITY_DN22596_c0_g1_i1:70-1041(-)